MHFLAIVAGLLSILNQVSLEKTITSQYGDTIRIPCQTEDATSEEVFLVKWKYEKADGSSGDLLVKKVGNEPAITAPEEFKDRLSMATDNSLLIADAVLSDQKTFTCMLVMPSNIYELQHQVLIHKSPDAVELTNNPAAMETGKLTTVGECWVEDANPAAKITWYRNQEPLEDADEGVEIDVSETVDPTTGLTSTMSRLQYTADKEDVGALFSCGVNNTPLKSQAVNFTINYPPETVNLEILTPGTLKEGVDITLSCLADGNPPPSSFNFFLPGQEEPQRVDNDDSYTMSAATRDMSGEYKCSPVDKPSLIATRNITVHYLDVSLSLSGSIIKSAGESLPITLQEDASAAVTVTWTKDNVSLSTQPQFDRLEYSDSGVYQCRVSTGHLTSTHSFELQVEGAPVITSLREQMSGDGSQKVLICEAEGFPKPTVEWSGVNGTFEEESAYVNGRVTHRLTVVPRANLTVTCMVMNDLGMDSKTAEVSSLMILAPGSDVTMDKRDSAKESGDQAKLAVGVVIGLLLVTAVIGLGYWLYVKKSKQGSWKTGEKEDANTEESKKLEEAPAKAEV